MNKFCHEQVSKLNELLKNPEDTSLTYFAEQVYEQGYIDGKEIERKFLRLKLGLDTKEDA